jgi:hypothetical protein
MGVERPSVDGGCWADTSRDTAAAIDTVSQPASRRADLQ